MGPGAKNGDSDEVATILEFFGIKLTTPNQQFAEFLRQDVRGLMPFDFSHGTDGPGPSHSEPDESGDKD